MNLVNKNGKTFIDPFTNSNVIKSKRDYTLKDTEKTLDSVELILNTLQAHIEEFNTLRTNDKKLMESIVEEHNGEGHVIVCKLSVRIKGDDVNELDYIVSSIDTYRILTIDDGLRFVNIDYLNKLFRECEFTGMVKLSLLSHDLSRLVRHAEFSNCYDI